MNLNRAVGLGVLFALLLALSGATARADVMTATPDWADASEATIHPGVQTRTEGGQCTANFVFFDGNDIYIGQAAHCSSTSDNFQTNGCEAGVLPLGTEVNISGATKPGTLAYNSWNTMQAEDEQDGTICRSNDLALVRIDPDDHERVNPSVPFWGGPSGLDASTELGERVYSYQNSLLRLGLSPLSPKTGFATGVGGWSHNVYTVSPGIPGDSGSAFLDSNGGALGVLSTIETLPRAGSNNVSDLSLALDYMLANTNFAAELAEGTEPFSPLI